MIRKILAAGALMATVFISAVTPVKAATITYDQLSMIAYGGLIPPLYTVTYAQPVYVAQPVCVAQPVYVTQTAYAIQPVCVTQPICTSALSAQVNQARIDATNARATANATLKRLNEIKALVVTTRADAVVNPGLIQRLNDLQAMEVTLQREYDLQNIDACNKEANYRNLQCTPVCCTYTSCFR